MRSEKDFFTEVYNRADKAIAKRKKTSERIIGFGCTAAAFAVVFTLTFSLFLHSGSKDNETAGNTTTASCESIGTTSVNETTKDVYVTTPPMQSTTAVTTTTYIATTRPIYTTTTTTFGGDKETSTSRADEYPDLTGVTFLDGIYRTPLILIADSREKLDAFINSNFTEADAVLLSDIFSKYGDDYFGEKKLSVCIWNYTGDIDFSYTSEIYDNEIKVSCYYGAGTEAHSVVVYGECPSHVTATSISGTSR